MSLKEVCRLCGESNNATEPLTPLLRNQIHQCFCIPIKPNDELPQNLCFKCLVIVSEFHSVMIKYQNKQVYLKSQFNKEKLEGKNTSVENVTIKLEPPEDVSITDKSVGVVNDKTLKQEKNVEEIPDERMDIDEVKIPISSPHNFIEDNNSLSNLATVETTKENDTPKLNQNVDNNKDFHPNNEDTGLNNKNSQNTSNDDTTRVPIWRISYNCSICNESFINKLRLRDHRKKMHKYIIDIYGRLCKKVCFVALKKLPLVLPNKVGFRVGPSWVHINKNKIQKCDLKTNFCYLSKVRQEVAKSIACNLDTDVTKNLELDQNSIISSTVKNVIDLTIENVAMHNKSFMKSGDEKDCRFTNVDNGQILNHNVISVITEKTNIRDNGLNSSTLNKGITEDVTDNSYALDPNEIYKTVIKCFSECAGKKGDFNTKFLNRIKLRSIGVFWIMNENSPFKIYFSKSSDLQKHSLKQNGLCANMIGLKPYTNKIQNQIPISQTMLNVRYVKLKESQVPIETTTSSNSIDTIPTSSSSLLLNDNLTPESHNSFTISESNTTFPKIISAYSLTHNGDEQTSSKSDKNTKYKPMIKCKPTALLMANHSNSPQLQLASPNSFLGIPNLINPPKEKSLILNKKFQEDFENDVILNYQTEQTDSQESKAKRCKTVKKYGRKMPEKSVCELSSVEIDQSFNVNEGQNRLLNATLDLNRNSGNDAFSKSTNSNHPNSKSFGKSDKLVDFEKVISSPVLFKNIDSQPAQNNLPSSLVPTIFVSIPETSVANNSQNIFSVPANNLTIPVNNMNVSLNSGSGGLTISHEKEKMSALIPIPNDIYQFLSSANNQSQNLTESSNRISQQSVFLQPPFFFPQSNQLGTDSLQSVIQSTQNVTKPFQSPQIFTQSVHKLSPIIVKPSQIIGKAPKTTVKPLQTVIKSPETVIKPPQTVIKPPQIIVKPLQTTPNTIQPVTQPSQPETEPSHLKNRSQEQSDGINGPFFQLMKAIEEKGVILCTHTDDKSVRSLVRFKILINEMYKDSNLSRTFHVKLSLLQNGSFLLNVTNSEQSTENVNDWSSQYQSQLIRAFQQKTVLNTISLMASTNPFNVEDKTRKFLQTLADFNISSFT